MPRSQLRSIPVLLSLFVLSRAGLLRADDAKSTTPPKGEVTRYTVDHSQILPGTGRDYWIYVPSQYDPARPACLYVGQDGIQYNAPTVFDELIAKEEIPVLIGVFVRPGQVKAPSDQARDRFNRSYEYEIGRASCRERG